MEPSSVTSSPDKSDLKPSFRKLTSDSANRKYRRHSPGSRSDSSLSGGSPRRERSHSPLHPREDHIRTSSDQRRRDIGRESERDSSHNKSSRGYDSQKYSDRYPYGNSHDYRRHEDHSRHHRHADEDNRNYQRSVKSGRESRNDSRSDYTKNEKTSDRYRDNWRTVDNHFKDKFEISEHKSKNKDRESTKDYDRADTGSKQVGFSKDYDDISEQDQRRERELRYNKRDYRRSPRSHRNYQDEEYRGVGRDSIYERDTGVTQRRENEKSSKKDVHVQEDPVLKRKHTEREGEKHREKYAREQEEFQNERKSLFSNQVKDERNGVDKASDSVGREYSSSTEPKASHLEHSSRQVKDTHEKVNSETIISATINAGDTSNVNTAKVAALKAAELVNRNLVGFGGVGCLSTDQKKKLLWGNKKNSPTEESSSRWDLHMFPDRERQEKFNRLMGVKGNVVSEVIPVNKDGNFQAKKQEELDTDLEKQYTAGLRRRDGRTVGLGL
ncbi:hypothetical protein Cni_G28979 [Canna indica]|uniref:Small acidic protein-like domain-containing protein n=1 Tax=Canna indica TaxID=4628 RepID=A0AAQ3QST4_9LILI|nr:hypothetical protein Cni_G28979 [Canna indica]